MKVLLLTPCAESTGGIQRYTRTLARSLQGLLGDQFVRCVGLDEDPAEQGKARLSARSKWRFGWQAVREAARWRPDLMICTHLALAPIAWGLATLLRRPYWVTLHGIEAWVPLPPAKRAALRHATRVIAASSFSQDRIIKCHQIPPERLSILPCAVDDSLARVEPAGTGPHELLNDGQQVILTVARMKSSERYKGHDVVLRSLPAVLQQVPNLVYVIVGDGDDRSRIEALARELGLQPHVIFTGSVSDPELVALYQRSDVFVLPARTVLNDHEAKGEGFGLVYLEAMAFGKPVIGPNCGAPAEIFRHQHQGLMVDPEDSRALGEALVSLLTNPEIAREMGRAGSEWVRQQFSFDTYQDRLQHLLPTL